MRLRVLLLCAVTASAGLGVVACSEKEPPAAKQSGGNLETESPAQSASVLPTTPGMSRLLDEPAAQPPRPTASASPRASAAPAAPASSARNTARGTRTAARNTSPKRGTPGVASAGGPVAPPDARYTLLVYKLSGPGHVEQARLLKEDLERVSGRKDWYLSHGSEDSRLHFGYYRSTNDPKDPKESERARADRALVAGVKMADGSFPFRAAAFVPLEAPDPTSRPEWNLANVDLAKNPKDSSRAFWSLQIMAFKDDPKRKEAAVQAVEALRANGHDAYYYHGETVSSVCVGAWPRLAIREQEGHGEHTVADPNVDLMVLSEPLPKSRKISDKIYRDGKRVVPVAPDLQIDDPSLQKMTELFPWHALNYEVTIRKTKDGQGARTASFLVEIPRAKGNGYYDSDDVLEGATPGGGSYVGGGAPRTSGTAISNPGGERGRVNPEPRRNYLDLTGDAPAGGGGR